jgi:XTP/dITP diphosphohydrolase
MELVIATYNQGKVREVEQALQRLPVQVRHLSEFPKISTVAEVGKTYQENAVLKARGYARQTGVCALADDSGLEVDALEGRPGVYSARYGGNETTDSDRISLLLSELSSVPTTDRSARFVCCMALAGWQATNEGNRSGEPEVLTVVEGVCEGFISTAPLGDHGFGFDPVFVPSGYQQTFAQLPDEVKATISHRARALMKIQTFIEHWRGPA